MIRLSFTTDGNAAERLRELAQGRLQEARNKLVRQAMEEALVETINRQPVDTGRARDAWESALASVSGGAALETSGEGSAAQGDSLDISDASATNAVPYITYLEYGTSKMSPFAMVRDALTLVRSRVATLFRL